MQAMQMEMAAQGEFPRVRTREIPEPGPGQALVRVEATGVSFAEQQMRRGKYYDQPKFPFVPGYDLVGMADGQRVAALTKVGGWADHVVLDRDGPRARAGRRERRGGRDGRRQRAHGLADAAPRGQGAARADDRRAGRGRRRRLGARAARAPRRRHGHRHVGPEAARARPRARRDADRLPQRGRARARARARAGRRRGRLRPRRRTGHRRLLADARARRHARLLRHRLDPRRARQPGAAGAQADRQAAGLERAAKRAQRDVLQPLGRPSLPPREVPRPAARRSHTGVRAAARRRDRAADRGALPARPRRPTRCASPRPAASRGRWCCCAG